MASELLLRGTDGRLYDIPKDVAEKYALSEQSAKAHFSKGGVTQKHAEDVPDFHVLLQTEYRAGPSL